MATRYRFGDSEYAHFITFAVVNWIDALSRLPLGICNNIARHSPANIFDLSQRLKPTGDEAEVSSAEEQLSRNSLNTCKSL